MTESISQTTTMVKVFRGVAVSLFLVGLLIFIASEVGIPKLLYTPDADTPADIASTGFWSILSAISYWAYPVGLLLLLPIASNRNARMFLVLSIGVAIALAVANVISFSMYSVLIANLLYTFIWAMFMNNSALDAPSRSWISLILINYVLSVFALVSVIFFTETFSSAEQYMQNPVAWIFTIMMFIFQIMAWVKFTYSDVFAGNGSYNEQAEGNFVSLNKYIVGAVTAIGLWTVSLMVITSYVAPIVK